MRSLGLVKDGLKKADPKIYIEYIKVFTLERSSFALGRNDVGASLILNLLFFTRCLLCFVDQVVQ